MSEFPSIFTPPGGPPRVPPPDTRIFKSMGQENIFRMLFVFYQHLADSEISWMFASEPNELKIASEKSACFFTQLLGGPPLFNERHGPPMLRRRHFPFAINDKARQVWVHCFRMTLENAVEDFSFPTEHLDGFIEFLEKFSEWMVNKET